MIVGGIADNYGNIWKKVSTQICIIECTLAKLEIKDGNWELIKSSVSVIVQK